MNNASFTSLETATADDWQLIELPEHANTERERQVDMMLGLLRLQKDEPTHGWPVNVYEHCLQTATLASQDGADDATIVCALFHDATEAFDLADHSESAARLLTPFVSENHVWMVRHHALFQDYHCIAHPTRFSHERERYRGHPAFDLTALFCERYDQRAFNGGFQPLPIEAFEPIVRRVLLAAA